MDSDNLSEMLQEMGIPFDVRAKIMSTSNMSVHVLKLMKFSDLMQKCGLSWDECRLLQKRFYEPKGIWKKEAINYKIFNDPIHGSMKIHHACVAIINTPQFQRLRSLKQLGTCYFVYPGAAHNRFEHSIGVCYLAGQVARTLRDNQPYLGITDIDILCVEIAGLCHDLGHGPFSHVFDGKVIPELKKRKGQSLEPKFEHEQMSVKMTDHLLKKNSLWSKENEDGKLTKWGLKQEDIDFIKELINPPKIRRGRGQEKDFLYEIVANKRNGIDVDKWDYLARDSHQLNITSNFDHRRYMSFLRVAEVEGEQQNAKELQLCARDKEILSLYDMYATRFSLHKRAYQHRVVSAMDRMIVDAMVACGDVKLIPGSNKAKCTILECLDDEEAYTNLTDTVLDIILLSDSDQELNEAKIILRRIFCREFYKCVLESDPLDPKQLNGRKAEDIEKEMLEVLRNSGKDSLTKDDFFVQIVSLDFGRKSENPLEHLCCYTRDSPDKPKQLTAEQVSKILVPSFFQEQVLRVYSRSDEKFALVKEVFELWYGLRFDQHIRGGTE